MTAVFDTRRFVGRLRDAGMSEERAYAVARLLADVRHEGFDPAIAHQDLVGSGFTDEQARVLIEETAGAVRPPGSDRDAAS